MMARSLIGASVLAVAAQMASAAPLDDCWASIVGHDIIEENHTDLGLGYVAHIRKWSFPAEFGTEGSRPFGAELVLTHCHSGEELSARYANADRAFARVVEEKMTSRTGAALAFFEATAESTAFRIVDKEPCACAAAYPNLRGEKTPYEVAE